MSKEALAKAMDFMENEKQFHLGFLPTEQSSPLTRNLDREFAVSCEAGVRNLQSVDRNVLAMAKRIFASDEFKKTGRNRRKSHSQRRKDRLFRMRSNRTFEYSAGMYVA